MMNKAAYRILLIGGAPRSGTSMLMRSLDWHSNIIMYPKEAEFLRICCSKKEVTLPTKKDFVFGDRNMLDALIQRQKSAGFKGWYAAADIDPASFANEYFRVWKANNGYSRIKRSCYAIGKAMCKASRCLKEKYSGQDQIIYAFKMPFYAEYSAAMIFENNPDFNLIWIGRNYYDRYTSTKARRLAMSKDNLIRPPVEGVDYSSFQAVLAVISRNIATELSARYPNRAMVIEYEDILRSPESYADKVSAFLGIDNSNSLLNSTYLGVEVSQPSSFNILNTHIGRCKGQRNEGRDSIVNEYESEYVKMLSMIADNTLAIRRNFNIREILDLAKMPFNSESVENKNTRVEYASRLLKNMECLDSFLSELIKVLCKNNISLL